MRIASISVRSIFLEAVEQHSAAEWPAYLDRACGHDPAMRREVEILLRAHAETGGPLDHLPPTPVETAEDPDSREVPGTVIGPYTLMDQIGEGGMGVVYMAEQSGPPGRRVALKLIRPGMDTKKIVARFEAERQALALMDHPHIARVLDGGATVTGRPYFVMELVHGVPISEYCDLHRFAIPERLELFVLVCRTAQHAHQKGIIHRDLKPSNILVAEVEGVAVPKVIDFGVARAVTTLLSERTPCNDCHQILGTPMYMSPEQADGGGEDLDRRTDIYSLGVLLYELLTGTTPYEQDTFRTASFDEIRQVILEQARPAPSLRLSSLGSTRTTVSTLRRADARSLARALRGELDGIVMKAMDKDRCRRYETASDFAADVIRFLTDQPVDASRLSPC